MGIELDSDKYLSGVIKQPSCFSFWFSPNNKISIWQNGIKDTHCDNLKDDSTPLYLPLPPSTFLYLPLSPSTSLYLLQQPTS
jgi:hypothetical protein